MSERGCLSEDGQTRTTSATCHQGKQHEYRIGSFGFGWSYLNVLRPIKRENHANGIDFDGGR